MFRDMVDKRHFFTVQTVAVHRLLLENVSDLHLFKLKTELMQAEIQWRNKVQFEAVADSGHTVRIDGPPDSGGENAGFRPMELMLLGVGGCTSFDVVNILTKSRQQITSCVTQITARRADSVPSVFESIHLHFVIRGDNVDTSKIERALRLTAEKYCSASIMLQRGGVEVSHSYELTPAKEN